MVIIASPANSSISNNNSNNRLCDASFSSYLSIKEKPFAESRQNLALEGVKKEEDGETEVFEAEKYFNGEEVMSTKVVKVDAKKYKYQKDEQKGLETREYTIQHGTPSVRSESSWNSQSALLRSAITNTKNKVQKKSFLAGLGCKCYCSDKNSVDVSDHAGEITYGVAHGKTTPKKLFNADLDANHSVNKGVYFQNNIAELSSVNSSLGNQLIKMQLEETETPRKSLQVFGSPILDRRGKPLTFDKKLAMPSWEGTTKVEEIGKYNDDDAHSDASSDLFEIESIKGKSNNNILGRPTSNVVSGCASPSFYAPSEASIEWSVVTASAVGYSAMSDYEDQRSVATIRSPIRTSYKQKVSREIPRQRSGSLLGCKSHKAVGVANDAFKTSEKPRSDSQFRRRSDTLSQVTRFQEETKKGYFGARHGQHAYAAPSLQGSH